jgi:hypothetical protein
MLSEKMLFTRNISTLLNQSREIRSFSPAFFTLLTPTAEPGENVNLLSEHLLKNAYIIYEIIHKDKVVSREILNLSKEQKLISIPVKEEYRGNFAISIAFVKNNRSFELSRLINVPYTNKNLDINFATFRNKLLPGQEEEWQITLRDSKGEKAAAEMLAGMYDASLDVFAHTAGPLIFSIISMEPAHGQPISVLVLRVELRSTVPASLHIPRRMNTTS